MHQYRKEIPYLTSVDVLVVGAGPAGIGAARAAAFIPLGFYGTSENMTGIVSLLCSEQGRLKIVNCKAKSSKRVS